MERKIPDLNKIMIISCFMDPNNISNETYLKKIEEFEIGCEKSLIDTLSRLDIKGFVKENRYSLPYKKEIIVTLPGESYMNGAFEFFRVARPIVKQLLNENVNKIRFYFYINIKEGNMGFGSVEYCFRYYTHY